MIRVTLIILMIGSVIAYASIRSHTAPVDPGPGTSVSTGRHTMRLTVTANESTVYGTAWDGIRIIGMFGPVMPELPVTSPPDLAVCIVVPEGANPSMTCHHDVIDGKPASICHDAFECAFEVTAPPDAPFGVVIYDVDTMMGDDRNDLVDAFVVAGQDGGTAEAEAATRDVVRRISRTDVEVPAPLRDKLEVDRLTVFPSEARRRRGPMTVLARGDCRAEPCKLSQSQVSINQK